MLILVWKNSSFGNLRSFLLPTLKSINPFWEPGNKLVGLVLSKRFAFTAGHISSFLGFCGQSHYYILNLPVSNHVGTHVEENLTRSEPKDLEYSRSQSCMPRLHAMFCVYHLSSLRTRSRHTCSGYKQVDQTYTTSAGGVVITGLASLSGASISPRFWILANVL